MTGTWWEHFPPAQAILQCSGVEHHLRWERGELHALDHDDVAGERALAALGGEQYPCIDLLRSWARHDDDLRVLAVASRGPTDPIRWNHLPQGWSGPPIQPIGPGPIRGMVPTVGVPHALPHPPIVRTLPRVVGINTAAAGAAQPEMDDLVTLLALGGAVPHRLVATVAARWTARVATLDLETSPERAALTAALYGRALCALRAWIGEPRLGLELELIRPGESPAISRVDQTVHASLPLEWIIDVWAHDLASILGRFALGVLSRDDDQVTLLTVGSALTDPRPMTISLATTET